MSIAKEQLKVTLTISKLYKRTNYLNDEELERLRLEIFGQTGFTPINFHQKLVKPSTRTKRKRRFHETFAFRSGKPS